MIPFAPRFINNTLYAEFGPRLSLAITPINDGMVYAGQPRRYEKLITIETDLIKQKQIEDMLRRNRIDGWRVPYFQIAEAGLSEYRKARRQLKRASRIEPAFGGAASAPASMVVTGLMGAALITIPESARQSVLHIAAAELAGISQQNNADYSEDILELGMQLNHYLRRRVGSPAWLDAAQTAERAFAVNSELAAPANDAPKQIVRRPGAAPRCG